MVRTAHCSSAATEGNRKFGAPTPSLLFHSSFFFLFILIYPRFTRADTNRELNSNTKEAREKEKKDEENGFTRINLIKKRDWIRRCHIHSTKKGKKKEKMIIREKREKQLSFFLMEKRGKERVGRGDTCTTI